MSQLVFRDEIVNKIKEDQVLFGKVAVALGIATRTLFDKVNQLTQNPNLATASVLRVLRTHLGVEQDDELLTELIEA